MVARRIRTLAGIAVLLGCGGDAGSTPVAAAPPVVVLSEVYETPRDTIDNIDSAAVWHGHDGRTWLLATAKETDVIVVYDGSTGTVLRRVGGTGNDLGQLDRPNGIAVADDLVWIVERDNARIQVFTLPDFRPVGSYGSDVLRKPYGVALVAEGSGVYSTFITDNYEFAEDVIPADSLLGERVRHFRVRVTGSGLTAELANTFGDVRGPGVLRVVESIAADPVNDRLLIAEEQEGRSMIKAYTLSGRFTGQIIDARFFPYQAEGIVLYDCGERGGYWIATDQSQEENTFHAFDRSTLQHLGSFRGRAVRNTDGIALTQAAFAAFTAGAFFAVHNDGSVAVFRWHDIANALGLRSDCAMPSVRDVL